MTLKRISIPSSLLVVLSTFLLTVGQLGAAPLLPQQVTFTAEELLGRPTDSSITINIVPDEAIELYYEYGTSAGVYVAQTPVFSAAGGQPHEAVIGGLQPDTQYHYRMQYRIPGNAWVARDEHSFWTQRAPGSSFTFTVTADSHLAMPLGIPALYEQTLLNVANDDPDFHLDLGDAFAMDPVTTAAGAQQAYLLQRSYMDSVSPSVPILLAIGNHEQEEGWHLDDTGDPATSTPVLGTNARKKYYPNPVPDGFYSGNADTYYALDGDQLHEDYYAWEWGDALFVVLDPFWYTTTKPFLYNIGGGEDSDPGSGDRWDWTLGQQQYNWFKQTIEDSDARYKFVFAHHMVGGSQDYVRGGAGPAHLVEWGGYDEDGTTWGFDTERPGWGGVPIHQLMTDNHVSAFFHGHDHQYAYEERDGIVYHSVPAAGITGNGFNIYHESDPYTIKVLPSSGHLRITVSPDVATVEYVRSDTTAGGINGVVSHSYTIEASAYPTITIAGTPLATFSSAPGEPSAEQSYLVSGTELVADIELMAPADFEISTTSGTGFGPSLTLSQFGGSVAETTVFVRFARAIEGTSSGDITHTSSGATTQTVSVTGTACTGNPPASVQVSIAHDATDVFLSWEDAPANSGGYQVHRSTLPYFLPNDGTKLGDPLPAGSTGYTDAGAAGMAGTSYTYIVQALNCDSGQTSESPPISVFNFALVH